MTEKIEPVGKCLGDILGRYERRPVILPPFQRPFSWDKAKVGAFWDDIISFREDYAAAPVTASYYLGSMVTLKSQEQIIVLDGQQRLATGTIALAVLRDVSRQLGKEGNDFARDIQRELVEKETDPVIFSLTLGELDEDYFRRAIKTDPPAALEPKLRSHQLIETAKKISRDRVEAMIKGLSNEAAVKKLKSFQNALTKGVSVIVIQVDSEQDAFQIFETLNDRGLRLSVPDLVLNLLMRRTPDKPTQKLVREKWNEMIRQLGRRDVSRFLRHMWLSRHGDVKSYGLYDVIKKNLETNQIGSLSFAEQCAEECDAYVALLDQRIAAAGEVKSDLEGLLKYLDAPNSLPVLLSGYKCLTDSDFAKLVKLALNHYIRWSLVANQNPSDLETTFYQAARAIRQAVGKGDTSAKALAAGAAVLASRRLPDAVIEEAAQSLELDRREAIWLLTRIANSMQSRTKEIGMDAANLEHIFPQNPGDEWPNKTDLEPFTWNIGNLTILGERLNRSAQNHGFSIKQADYYSKSEIEMTRKLLAIPSWDPLAITTRARELGQLINRLWRAT